MTRTLVALLTCAGLAGGCASSAEDRNEKREEVLAARAQSRANIAEDLSANGRVDRMLLSADISILLDVEREVVLPARIWELHERLAPSDPKESRVRSLGWYPHYYDLGFGATYERLQLRGGFGDCVLQVASFEGKIFEVQASCGAGPSGEGLPWLADELAELARRMKRRPNHTLELVIRDRAVRRKADAARERALGEIGAPRPGRFERDFEWLTSPIEAIVVGTSCGMVPETPRAAAALDRMAEAERWDLVHAIMRGPNPGARLLAAFRLRRSKQTTPEDEVAINRLREHRAPLETCGGCFGRVAFARDILDDPRSPKRVTQRQ